MMVSYRAHRAQRGPVRDASRPVVTRSRAGPDVSAAAGARPAEVDEEPAPVVAVLLDPVVQRLDLLLFEEPQHLLLQLAGALAGDDLDRRGLLGDGLVDDAAQGPVDLLALVEDVVQVQLELHATERTASGTPGGSRSGG